MNAAFLAVAALEQVVAVPLVLRLAVGPTVCDRAVALNAFSAQVTRCAGMLVAFGLLAAACVAFGALPTLVLDHVVRPAAGSLVHGAEYARATLADGGRVTPAEATFDYADPRQALVICGTLLLGLLARWVVRHCEPSLLTAVRRAHTGSVNDYASYAVMGVVVSVAVLVLT
ncbi:MAG TPA: hypothetical protein VIL10_03870 [Marmoricola sp.]